ncbi:hypothetical protein [Shewanella putrefaciens]|uniref:hypothetical protein n=1 Tax=Shewanella putrefaciens TaxID=24 RepID=UPI00285D8113|nr:hypothetical protein [Shewanella putrefaciens]MDR6963968.1 hypothetical protein [Shewanella putrefaciens]
MKSKLAILNTDQINKYDYRFSLSALESGLKQTWDVGTPSFISHDYHRPYAWCQTLGLWIMPHQAALMGNILTPTDKEEQERINNLCSGFISRKIQDVSENEKDKLLSSIDNDFISENAIVVQRECVSILDDNIARKMFPEIFLGDETDKHSLISLRKLNPIQPGIFEYKGLVLFAHRFFRRSLSQFNNLNIPFLQRFQDLLLEDELDLKIAIDPHSLGLIGSYKKPIELDFWWGPKFSDDLNNIPLGVTLHRSNDKDEFFSGVSKTEFWWHHQDGIQSLECEELRETPSYGFSCEKNEELYGCRYVHSMVNDEGKAYHLDGAVRVYNEDQFINRLDVDISKAGKNTEYYKLWRIDGAIDISLWKSLISDFYKDNHLIGEYFLGGNRKIQDFKYAQDVLNTTEKYLQHNFFDEDGMQAFLSYNDIIEKEVVEEEDIFFCPVEYLSDDQGNRWRFIDFRTLDFIKALRLSTNFKLKLPKGTKYFYFYDYNINLPLLICKSGNHIESVKKIFDCIKIFIDSLNSVENEVITLAVGIEYEKVLAKFSLIFKPEGFLRYMQNNEIVFPSDLDKVGEWIEEFQNSLSNIFKDTTTTFHDSGYISQIGQFTVNRKYIPNDMIFWGPEFGLKIHKSDEEIIGLIQSEKMSAAPVISIDEVKCENCNGNYITCECDLIMKDKIIDAFEPISMFWSRKSTVI